MSIQRALLLIADIGGYTRFMKVHRINLAHAQDVVSQLLEAVIDGAPAPLKLAKLEGDAAFFYAPMSGSGQELAGARDQIVAIRRSFRQRLHLLSIDRVCTCEGCTQVDQLTLKFVAHEGEVAIHKVKRWTELSGVDVILVHRMLKNSVPVREYALMTEALARALPAEVRERGQRLDEELEGLGRVPLTYVHMDELDPTALEAIRPSFFRRWGSQLLRIARSVPYLVGAKKACDDFRNFDPTGAAPS
jgi:hypothetical protein